VRYPKGSIALNHRLDKAFLNFIGDSRCVTHSQLFAFAQLDQFEFNKRVFNWSIRRLVRNGLVRKQVPPFLRGEAMYSIQRGGIHALEQLGVFYLGANLDRDRDTREEQIPLALEVINILLALLGTRRLWQWTPEPFIRVLNLSPAHAYAKVYDGIAKVYLNGEDATFAIEYERTLKSRPKYEKIREAIESEKRLHGFLYLVASYELCSCLTRAFWGTKRLVFFGLVREFKRQLFDAPLGAADFSATTVREALSNVAALEKSKR